MGSFACICGATIQDSFYPNPNAGDLYWQDSLDSLGTQAIADIRSFLAANAGGDRVKWLVDYFSADYPSDLDDAVVIDDIHSKVARDKGHCVYRCPECDRLYVQKRISKNEWRCYEPKD